MAKSTSFQERLLHRLTRRIRQSLDLSEILTTAVQEIQMFLGVDRVKVYRFDADGSGVVIAEAIHNHRLPPLLNLRFPASDIPEHSRDMFLKVRQRVIVDVPAQRRIVNGMTEADSEHDRPLNDMRYAIADPCHVQYLNAMGVAASLILPILHHNHLWGLLAVHHASSHQFAERELQIVQLLVDQISIAIAQAQLLTQARLQAYHEATINQISQLLHCPMNPAEMRQAVLEAVVGALNGSGGRLYITAEPTGDPAQLYQVGAQPPDYPLEELPIWQDWLGWNPNEALTLDQRTLETWQQEGRTLLARSMEQLELSHEVYSFTLEELQNSDTLSPLAEVFSQTPIRAIAIIPLRFRHQLVGCLSVFRNGYDTEIQWAGYQNPDTRYQGPRQSFEIWREIKTNLAPEWTEAETRLMRAIGLHLYMAIVQKRVEALIRYQASHDALTKLPNRTLFDEQVSLALAQAKQHGDKVGVMFLDLDRFKTINDTLGHAMGDQLLQDVSQRLRCCLRDSDAIARWGGDEFTLLVPRLSIPDEVTAIAQRILEVLSAPFYLNTQELYITASLGIAIAPYDGEDAATLLKHADAAMYRAKQRGKNNYQLYDEDLSQQALKRLVMEGDLRRALTKQEFLLHYQPQVDIQTGQVIGVEALLRWNHTQLGWIPPSQFIPLAEETGFICPLGDWVLRTACEQHRLCCAQGLPPLRMAVNLSARQFQQPNLAGSILNILQLTGVNPRYLEVEITETAAMHDLAYTIDTLNELRRLGVQISIDDFGTGYSSLSAIKHFPLHTLKLDQSFVQGAVYHSSDAAIAKAITSLGHGLGLNVLAEGVETPPQLSFLHAIQCKWAQGHLFSTALAPDDLVAWLKHPPTSTQFPWFRDDADAKPWAG